jgi:hypothetical protein
MDSKKEHTVKQNWTMYIYKTDRRTKTGERLFSTTVWKDRTRAGMVREVHELVFSGLYPVPTFRFEYVPTTKVVKNLMTGKDVEIAHDTPWCCNPASETYWSM